MRVGLGYDIHRLVPDRPLRLGGVAIPFDRGLHGHSDGDVLLHAVCDALLGAAALGDIGELFPDSDPAFEGADSARLLETVVERLRRAGFRPVNVDVNVVAQEPRLAPHREAVRARLAALLGIEAGRVSVKVRSNEGLDAVGRGEAIAAQAIVLIQQTP